MEKTPLYLNDKTLNNLLDWSLINYIEKVLKSNSTAPLRASLQYEKTWFGAMPAAGLGIISTKLVGVYPDNPKRGLPTVRGLVTAFDSKTGELLFLADAAPITGFRTAAATCLALKLLDYNGGGSASIIGAGVQGYYHAKCLIEHYDVEKLIIYDIDNSRAKRLVERLGERAILAESFNVIYNTNPIITATTSTKPIINGEKLLRDTIVASIGAPKPVKELDQKVLEKGECVLVDTKEGYWSEAGESEYTPNNVKIVEMRNIIIGKEECNYGEVRVYKGVGNALFDHAATLLIKDKLEKHTI